MKDRTCIRVLADENQINQCKKDIIGIEKKVEDVAGILSLTGNAIRMKMLFLLYREKQMCPCDISDVLEMSVPAISQHLRKLKDGGMIKDKKVGQTIFYSLVKERTQLIMPLLKQLAQETNKQKAL